VLNKKILSSGLSEKQFEKIKAEVRQAAIKHLNAKDADTALSHYTEDVIAVSNDQLYTSFEVLSEHVKSYYKILKEVNLAVWDEMHISILNTHTALITAKFRYSFTNISSEKTDLQGIWTALYVRENSGWKIRMRHESFSSLKN
jgi:ketosteroid isomerase-like protein